MINLMSRKIKFYVIFKKEKATRLVVFLFIYMFICFFANNILKNKNLSVKNVTAMG